MHPVVIHPHPAQGVVHPLTDFRRRNAEVFGRESHVILHHIRHDLIVRILKNHADRAAHIQYPGFVRGIYAAYRHLAGRGQEYGVEQLCQGAFTGAVMTQNHRKAAFFYFNINSGQRFDLIARIGVVQAFRFYYRRHIPYPLIISGHLPSKARRPPAGRPAGQI